MNDMEIEKIDQLNIYYLYTAAVLGKKEFTVAEISQLFKEDTADWDKTKSTTNNTSMHAHLSSMFIEHPEYNKLMIARKENKNKIWVYSIDLDNKIIAENAIKFLTDFIDEWVIIHDVIKSEDGQFVPDTIELKSDIYIKKIRIFDLIEWLNKETNFLQEYEEIL